MSKIGKIVNFAKYLMHEQNTIYNKHNQQHLNEYAHLTGNLNVNFRHLLSKTN